jgi:GNAT superfamily N-acetyltransferase
MEGVVEKIGNGQGLGNHDSETGSQKLPGCGLKSHFNTGHFQYLQTEKDRSMSYQIRKCTSEDINVLAATIRGSFRDVAERFGLTAENCPRHASNCSADWIEKDMDRGVTYFVLESEGRAVGSVALEQPKPGVCYLERLSVLPHQRRQGFGKALVAHVLSEARGLGCIRVGIGVIADQTELKDWYRKIGFEETDNRAFSHLPFLVTFMFYRLS